MRPRMPGRSLRTRLLLSIGLALAVVCAAMALTIIYAQRAYLLGNLDQRVSDAAERSQGGLQRRTGDATDLGFLNERGQPAGTIAARLDAEDDVAAEFVDQDAVPQPLTAAQVAALDGIPTDGSLHTRTVPGLGTYRVTAIDGEGLPVLVGLPMDDVQNMINGLFAVEAGVAAATTTSICSPPAERRACTGGLANKLRRSSSRSCAVPPSPTPSSPGSHVACGRSSTLLSPAHHLSLTHQGASGEPGFRNVGGLRKPAIARSYGRRPCPPERGPADRHAPRPRTR